MLLLLLLLLLLLQLLLLVVVWWVLASVGIDIGTSVGGCSVGGAGKLQLLFARVWRMDYACLVPCHALFVDKNTSSRKNRRIFQGTLSFPLHTF